VSVAAVGGPRGILRLIVQWAFIALEIALFVRVLSTWVSISPSSRWVRWSYVLTEWMLRPLRRVLPPVGGAIDISPIVAYIGIWLVSGWVLRAL
jgi:YggT family protein